MLPADGEFCAESRVIELVRKLSALRGARIDHQRARVVCGEGRAHCSIAATYLVGRDQYPRCSRTGIGSAPMRSENVGHAQDQMMCGPCTAGSAACLRQGAQISEPLRNGSGACISLRRQADHAGRSCGKSKSVQTSRPRRAASWGARHPRFPPEPLPSKPHDLATRRAVARGDAALGVSSGGVQGRPVRSSM